MLCKLIFFFFNDTATTEIYTLSLHDALPISHPRRDEAPGDAAREPGAARADAPGGDARPQPHRVEGDGRLGLRLRDSRAGPVPRERSARPQGAVRRVPGDPGAGRDGEIGRASCRE